MGYGALGGAGTGCGGPGLIWTSAGVILVLYILLVIVLRGGFY